MRCAAADSMATASGEANLQSCLQQFFHKEDITWECPGEKQAKKELRRSSLGTDKALPSTPVADRQGEGAADERTTCRTVSFSGRTDITVRLPKSLWIDGYCWGAPWVLLGRPLGFLDGYTHMLTLFLFGQKLQR